MGGHSIVRTVLETNPNFFIAQEGDEDTPEARRMELDPAWSDNLFGTLLPSSRGAGVSRIMPSMIEGLPTLNNSTVFCFVFLHPQFPEDHVWKSGLLPNV